MELKVNELRKKLKGHPINECNILIQVYDGFGNPHLVNCQVEDIINDEQNGEFYTAVVLHPDYESLLIN